MNSKPILPESKQEERSFFTTLTGGRQVAYVVYEENSSSTGTVLKVHDLLAPEQKDCELKLNDNIKIEKIIALPYGEFLVLTAEAELIIVE